MLINDPYFYVTINGNASSPNPEAGIWEGQHVCVAELGGFNDSLPKSPGSAIVRHQLEGDRGHYAVAAFAYAKIDCSGFPHDCVMQLRTHHTSGTDVRYLVQSNRYTSKRFLQVADDELNPEVVFYYRPIGKYPSREGISGVTEEKRARFYQHCIYACKEYAWLVSHGEPFERARWVLPAGIRQDFTIGATLKGHWHWLDQRSKKDAQYEIQVLARMAQDCLLQWSPVLSKWYEENRYGKARLAP